MKKGIIFISIVGPLFVLFFLSGIIFIVLRRIEVDQHNLSIYNYEHTGKIVYSCYRYLNYKEQSIYYGDDITFFWVDDTCIIYEENQKLIYEDYNNKNELFDYKEYNVLKIVKRDSFLYISCVGKKYYKYDIFTKNMESIDGLIFEDALYGDSFRIEWNNNDLIIHNLKDSSNKSISFKDFLNCEIVMKMKTMITDAIDAYIPEVGIPGVGFIIDGSNIYFTVDIGSTHKNLIDYEDYELILKYDYENDRLDYYDWLKANDSNGVNIFFITENVGYPLLKYFHFWGV